jgi:hypothetical protein
MAKVFKKNGFEGKKILRGFGGSGGNRSMMTERGGTGRAANFRITI